MKKIFLLVQGLLIFGVSTKASEEAVFSFTPDREFLNEEQNDDDFVIVTKEDVSSYSKRQALLDKINDEKNAVLNKVKKQIEDEFSKSIKKQTDLVEEKFNKWLEENIANLIEAAILKAEKAVTSGSNYLYEGAKKRFSRGWDWLVGAKNVKTKLAPLAVKEKDNKLMENVGLETILDLD